MSAPLILECQSVSKQFGGLIAVNNVDLTVHQGEVVGLIGPNGAGKTTLFNIICGTFPPSKGTILFDGQNITGLAPHRIAQIGIARTFQIAKPFNRMTVLENVLVAAGYQFINSSITAVSAKGMNAARDAALAILERVGLADDAFKLAKELNLGLIRRLEIARALALRPRVLMLDEPIAGLGYDAIAGLTKLLLDLRDQGLTILLVEHNTAVAKELCDRIVVLDRGVKIAEGNPLEVFRLPQVVKAYLGEEGSHGPA